MTGERYGRLTVLEYIGTRNKNAVWLCMCDCGNKVVVQRPNLIHGNTTSCGCYQKEKVGLLNKKYNTYDLSGEYGVGYTQDGIIFYFDLEDYELIKDYYWHEHKEGYIRTKISNLNRPMIHQIISEKYFEGNMLDHINGNPRDNRKRNLRVATQLENAKNHKVYKTNQSGYSGVFFLKTVGKWQSYIYYNCKRIDLGLYNLFDDAINARKIAEEQYFGEFRRKDDDKCHFGVT